MKNILKFTLLVMLASFFYSKNGQAQNVVITDTIYTGDSSAVLDIFSYKRGLLVPRLTESDRNAIQAPAQSLLIYQIDNKTGFYYYNGSNWLSFIENNFRVYPNYDSLRADSLFNGSHCFVENFSYSYNGKNYLTYGGYFIRSDSGQENGGTILKNKNNVLWHRDWDQLHVQPEWWQVGGYDEQGLKYEDDFKAQGIQHDGDRLHAVTNISTKEIVIELRPNYVYEHRQHAISLNKGGIINGNGATIKRQKCTSALVAPVTVGSGTFTVQDASSFRIGDEVLAFAGNSYGAHSMSTPSWNHVITAIVGNQIFVTPNASKAVPSGTVQITSDQVLISNGAAINNTIFDGNEQEMNATNSWNHVRCILSYNKGIHINKCKFLNMPSDVIICPSELWVSDCYIENLASGFIHGSSGLANGFESAGVFIKNIKGSDICKVSAAVNGHASQHGFYTQSVATNNLMIEGCYITKGNSGGIITPLIGGGGNFCISNNYFDDFGHILTNINSNGNTDLRVTNNNFYNCGVLNFEANINSAGIWSRVNISDNTFTNCQLVLNGADKVMLSNNQFYCKPNATFTNFDKSKETFNNSGNGLISLSTSDAIISNNTLLTEYFDTRASVGLYLSLRTNSTFRNCMIDNNQIIGFHQGINTIFAGGTAYRENLTISNNVIETKNHFISNISSNTPTNVTAYGIQSGHGARIINNYIKHGFSTPAIRAYGTTDENAAISNVITGNFIEGPAHPRQIELIYYKNIVNNNTLSGGIGYLHSIYAAKNIVGINYQYNTANYTINPIRNTNIQQLTGSGAPIVYAQNGSTYIDKASGEIYIRISNVWKKIVVQ